DPLLVEQFIDDAPRLCTCLEREAIWTTVLDAEPGAQRRLSPEQAEITLQAMANFVDLKTSFTVDHSRRVASLAAAAAQRCNLPMSDVMSVRCAGYVHDLGRVCIPAA